MPLAFRPIPDLTSEAIIRLWAGVELGLADECWLWTKGRDNGYGKISIHGSNYTVTRVIWKHWYGIDPGNLDICHNCNNPPCCNPNHLFKGTRSENVQHSVDCGRTFSVGTFHGRTELTENDVKIIRQRLDRGESAEKICVDYNLTPGAIYHIKHRRTWSHVHG